MCTSSLCRHRCGIQLVYVLPVGLRERIAISSVSNLCLFTIIIVFKDVWINRILSKRKLCASIICPFVNMYFLFLTDFDEDFTEYLIRELPGTLLINTSNADFRALRNELIDNFEIPDEDDFNVRSFVDSLLDSFSNVLEDTYESASEDCISGVIQSQLNQDAVNNMAMQLPEICRSISTLQRIGMFLQRQLGTL